MVKQFPGSFEIVLLISWVTPQSMKIIEQELARTYKACLRWNTSRGKSRQKVKKPRKIQKVTKSRTKRVKKKSLKSHKTKSNFWLRNLN